MLPLGQRGTFHRSHSQPHEYVLSGAGAKCWRQGTSDPASGTQQQVCTAGRAGEGVAWGRVGGGVVKAKSCIYVGNVQWTPAAVVKLAACPPFV